MVGLITMLKVLFLAMMNMGLHLDMMIIAVLTLAAIQLFKNGFVRIMVSLCLSKEVSFAPRAA